MLDALDRMPRGTVDDLVAILLGGACLLLAIAFYDLIRSTRR